MKRIRILIFTLAISISACGEADTDETTDTTAMQDTTTASAPDPDTSASGMWSYLQEVSYQDSWSMWPGKTALYQGQDPHGALLTTYVNSEASSALADAVSGMPDGAVIVKENYMPDSTLAAVTVMYKEDGYNPEHDDWWWAKYGPGGDVEASGRVQGCISCHGQRADNDYILTETLSASP